MAISAKRVPEVDNHDLISSFSLIAFSRSKKFPPMKVMVSRLLTYARAGCTFTWLRRMLATIARDLAAWVLSAGGLPGQRVLQAERPPSSSRLRLALTFKIARM